MINRKPRIVCIGSNLESEIVIKGLVANQVNVVGLVTRPAGQPGSTSDYIDLHPFCVEHQIPTVDTIDINSTSTLSRLKALSPDYVFTLGWSQLFKAPLLRLPSQFIVGSHPSPLPKGRGRAPVPWTILQGHKRSAITLFRMDIGVDSGPILLQKWFDVPEGVYAIDLYQIVANNLRDAFLELYEMLCFGEIEVEEQDLTLGSYRAKRSPEDGHLDFHNTANELEVLIRAVSYPYPGAYTYYKDKVIRVWKASLDDIPAYTGQPGQILTRRNGRLLVQAGDAPIWLGDLTDEDGEEIDVSVFRRGSKFGYQLEDEIYHLRKELELLKRRLSPDEETET
jgi:methionyl-tRNA formyltransferase